MNALETRLRTRIDVLTDERDDARSELVERRRRLKKWKDLALVRKKRLEMWKQRAADDAERADALADALRLAEFRLREAQKSSRRAAA